MVALRSYWLLGLVLLTLTGCTASSDYMRKATAPPALGADARTATVVFVRPSGFAGAISTTILDGHGRFLGDSLPESYFAVQVPPGEHVFISWGENTAALRASLLAGRVYYVEVSPTLGVMSARVHLLAIKPTVESWGKLDQWLKESAYYQPDLARGQAYLTSRQADVAERVRRANEILTEYDTEELALRTLGPGDGTAGAGAEAALPVQQTAAAAQPPPPAAPAQ